jgi:ACS family glucarate transporter-like MFS transporter/ACS family D-galactonate transporter-like MFS transporter
MNLSDKSLRPYASHARLELSFWLACAAASAYLCRQCLVVAEKSIRLELNISEYQMGVILGPAFFWSYALAQLPGGWLGQLFSTRIMIPLYIVIWSLGTACWGLSGGFLGLLIGRLMVGIAQAGIFPCSAIVISHWYPATERARASSVLAAAMQIGGAAAAFLTVILLRYMSWQKVFVGYAMPGLLIAAGFYWWFRDDPAKHRRVNEVELQKIRGGSKKAVPRPALSATPLSLWLLNCQQFFRAAGQVWFGSWFATYLQETRNVSQEKSGWLLGILLLLTFVASLLSGSVSDLVFRKTGSLNLARRGVATTSLLLCGVLVFSAYWIEDATWATITIGAGVFFATFAGPCSYAAAIDMGGRNVATVFAVMNMVGNFGAGLLALTVPYFRAFIDHRPALLEMSGDNSWNAVLILFGSMYLMAAACWMFLHLEPPASVKETDDE